MFTRIDDIPSTMDHGTAFLCLCVGIVSCKLQPASEECRPGGCAGGVDVVVSQPDGWRCQGVNVGSHKRAGRIRKPNVCITLVVGQAANKMNLDCRASGSFGLALFLKLTWIWYLVAWLKHKGEERRTIGVSSEKKIWYKLRMGTCRSELKRWSEGLSTFEWIVASARVYSVHQHLRPHAHCTCNKSNYSPV